MTALRPMSLSMLTIKGGKHVRTKCRAVSIASFFSCTYCFTAKTMPDRLERKMRVVSLTVLLRLNHILKAVDKGFHRWKVTEEKLLGAVMWYWCILNSRWNDWSCVLTSSWFNANEEWAWTGVYWSLVGMTDLVYWFRVGLMLMRTELVLVYTDLVLV